MLLPDCVGNSRLDGYVNLLSNAQIGILVMVPGMGETLRINGSARITNDESLLADSAVKGRAPRAGILVTVQEAFLHCPKAFVHSGL